MKVLIVEDNDHLRLSMVNYVRDEGFAADEARDGEEALYKAAAWHYNAIILDVMIPPPDGFEVLRRLRAAGIATPVILLTARTSIPDRIRGLNAGADDYLAKPFEMEELMARLHSLIRRSLGASSPTIEVGSLRLQTSVREAFLHGEKVELTAREFGLLELLVHRRDEVVSRDALIESLFDERDDSISNMLDVYIYRLRQKLGKDRIVTRRRQGYQFVA